MNKADFNLMLNREDTIIFMNSEILNEKVELL